MKLHIGGDCVSAGLSHNLVGGAISPRQYILESNYLHLSISNFCDWSVNSSPVCAVLRFPDVRWNLLRFSGVSRKIPIFMVDLLWRLCISALLCKYLLGYVLMFVDGCSTSMLYKESASFFKPFCCRSKCVKEIFNSMRNCMKTRNLAFKFFGPKCWKFLQKMFVIQKKLLPLHPLNWGRLRPTSWYSIS